MMATRDKIGVNKNGKLLFSGYRVSIWEDEKVLEMKNDDGCTTRCIYLMQLNYVL